MSDRIIPKLFSTTSDLLNTIEKADGKIIALSDRNAWMYDMNGERRIIAGNVQCDALPSSGYADTLYIVTSGDAKGVYIYADASTGFVKVSELDKEYEQFAGSNPGLVPTATSEDQGKFLAADGTWRYVESSDTTNTAGATDAPDSGQKLYLVGAETQGASVQTYTDVNVYSQSGKLFSNNSEVLNKAGVSQSVSTAGSDEIKVPTNRAVYDAIQNAKTSVNNYTDTKAEEVENKLNSAKSTLEASIESTKNELNDAIDDTKEELEDTIQSSVNSAKSDLNSALNTAKGDLEKSIEDAKSEFESSISDAKTELQSYVDGAIGDIIQFRILSVDKLPETGDDHTIYLVTDESGKTGNEKLEYLYINGKWEMIGSTQVDLEGYAKTEDIDSAKSEIQEEIEEVKTTKQDEISLVVENGQICIRYEIDA